MNGATQDIWVKGLSKECGRLEKGNIHADRSTDIIKFNHRSKVPHNREVTYTTFVLDYIPLKNEPCRVLITVRGDWLTYLDNIRSPAVNMMETKIFLNSTISDAK